MADISHRNEMLTEPLKMTELQVQELRVKLKNFEKDHRSLVHATNRHVALDEQYTQLQIDHDAMLKEYAQVQEERDELYNTFEDTVLSVQEKSNRKNVALKNILDDQLDQFESKKVCFVLDFVHLVLVILL